VCDTAIAVLVPQMASSLASKLAAADQQICARSLAEAKNCDEVLRVHVSAGSLVPCNMCSYQCCISKLGVQSITME
jgi:hypothetical protein